MMGGSKRILAILYFKVYNKSFKEKETYENPTPFAKREGTHIKMSQIHVRAPSFS
jgi:hypothetical protein